MYSSPKLSVQQSTVNTAFRSWDIQLRAFVISKQAQVFRQKLVL